MIDQLVEAGILRRNVELGSLTTYKLGGPARWFAEPADLDELRDVLHAVHRLELPVITIGRGSNVVIASSGVEAVVIRLGSGFATVDIGEDGTVTAGGAMSLPRVARFAAEHDRGGLEFLVGVPGSVGGAVRMNAGCFGSETAEWLIDASIVSVSTAASRAATPADLDMRYRSTNVTTDDIVTSARFRTISSSRTSSLARMREITAWRKEHQPGGTYNAGSAFKNPEGDAAGRIIDAVGLKGFRVGGASVSHRHANFFEAGPEATPEDVYALFAGVRERVAAETGIELVPEVVFLGSFEDGT